MTDNVIALRSPSGTTARDLADIGAILTARRWDVADEACDDGQRYVSIVDPMGAPWQIIRQAGKFHVLPPRDNGLTGPTLSEEALPQRPRTAREAAEIIRAAVLADLV